MLYKPACAAAPRSRLVLAAVALGIWASTRAFVFPLSASRAVRAPRVLRRVDGAVVEAEPEEDEVAVWQEAYALELERAELLDAQLQQGLERLEELSAEMKEEFEGCLVDLEEAPEKPGDSEAAKWSEAYLGVRRCNEQLELKVNELRARITEKEDEKSGDYYGWTARMDLGPIQYRGIKFADIQFDRYHREKGSSFYFVELKLPLGLQLEEVEIEGIGTVIQVVDIKEGGSALQDGSIRPGDFLRAVTTPQRKLSGEQGEEGDISETFGVNAGQQTKAVLVIPRGFPFQKVLEEISENQKLDSMAGLAFERPFKDG